MKVSNLMETIMYASLCTANQPDSRRLVIIQTYCNKIGRYVIVGARFHVDTWFGDTTGDRLELSDNAVWMESPYQEFSDADDPLASDGSTRVLDAATKGRQEWKD